MKLTDLTISQIFRAGFVQGMLTKSEEERYAILGKREVTQRIVEKNVFEEFAKKSPKEAAEYKDTIELLFGK
jgi:hypothetical protein